MKIAAYRPRPEEMIARDVSLQGENWRHWAICAEVDPELFFPATSGPMARSQTRAAKALCARCPVAAECLEWALDSGTLYGIWGGHTEGEREEMLRDRGGVANRRYFCRDWKGVK